MELLDKRSAEIISFFKKMDEAMKRLKSSFDKSTPNLRNEKYLTNSDLCVLLHISKRSLQEYRDNGTLPFIKLGGKILYKESDIMKMLDENYQR